MDILELIKNRRTIRKYKNKPIPKKIVDKIIQAGIWGPSLMAPGFQPWKFVFISDQTVINKIGDILFKKSLTRGVGRNAILKMASETINNSPMIVVIYNTLIVSSFAKRINIKYYKFSKIAEISAISAAIQNMILTAEQSGIGSCWLEAPMFCSRELNNLLSIHDELVAVVTMGYPAEEGKRSPRRPLKEVLITLNNL